METTPLVKRAFPSIWLNVQIRPRSTSCTRLRPCRGWHSFSTQFLSFNSYSILESSAIESHATWGGIHQTNSNSSQPPSNYLLTSTYLNIMYCLIKTSGSVFLPVNCCSALNTDHTTKQRTFRYRQDLTKALQSTFEYWPLILDHSMNQTTLYSGNRNPTQLIPSPVFSHLEFQTFENRTSCLQSKSDIQTFLVMDLPILPVTGNWISGLIVR
jgi:hypothetical protein